MNETCENAKVFLDELVGKLGFDLSVSAEWTDEGCLINLSGEDAHIALTENGELLDAFETVLFQAFGRGMDREHRFVVDAEGFQTNTQSRAARNG